jgi:hypothetical protein
VPTARRGSEPVRATTEFALLLPPAGGVCQQVIRKASALACRNLAEAIVLGGDAIRRAAPRAKQLRAGQKAVATKRKAGTLKTAGVKAAATRAANKAANAS